jgi:hypothetical protein
LSLVISQTEDVHEEIVDLLEQLRRNQDLQVTIEVRFITLSDTFFERIGVDFDFNVVNANAFIDRLSRAEARASGRTLTRVQPRHRVVAGDLLLVARLGRVRQVARNGGLHIAAAWILFVHVLLLESARNPA